MRQVTGRWTRRQFGAGLAATGVMARAGWAGALVPAPWTITGEAAVRELMAGNERFAAGKITSFAEDLEILKVEDS